MVEEGLTQTDSLQTKNGMFLSVPGSYQPLITQWKKRLHVDCCDPDEQETPAALASLPGSQWGLFVETFVVRGEVRLP